MQLKIVGHTLAETTSIDSLNYVKNHENYLSIKREIDSLQKILYKIGYIENELKNIHRVNDSVFLTEIHLKKKYTSIFIYYDKSLFNPKLLNVISKNVFDTYFTIPFIELEKTLHYINSKISEKGFPFSKLHLFNIEIDNKSNLKANLILETTNQKRVINDIIIKGYNKFPSSYLIHYLKIKPNQTFNLNVIKTKTEQLNNLKFASEIKSPEVLFSKDSTTLYLYLQKTKSNSFDGFLGFGTNEDTNKLQFDGYLNLNLTNNLNYGESFKLLYKSDESDQKTFETNLSLPYLFKSPIGLDFALRIFKRDSSFTTVNQGFKIHYQINTKHKIYSGISSTQSSNLLNISTSSNIYDYKTSYFTFAYQYLKNQNLNSLFPVNSLFYLESNFGRRTESSQQEKQSLLNIDAFKILKLDIKNSLYFRINGAALNSKTYFENELILFGGINSIRGFEENSIFATSYGLLNSEYRFLLNNSIYIHTITDWAYFENKILNINEKLLGIGFGFGILTKTGLLKFNYANGKTENTPFKLSNSKIHLSLSANF
ncbi:POTRA domain-containing protein [Mariniflexile litorale]|uniref:POTRA domain-containing protein n=1 Tax=Mariniflexile litorale TaxID=3045158 RepID=A0AAU7EB73_9FLAO|nr:POTRA domain-containing protein [Mariniflexile sp. KMM 9835]MDQ8212527.1 POTRA domain-containing protein [Mariniflexile sp. KMM 9835]